MNICQFKAHKAKEPDSIIPRTSSLISCANTTGAILPSQLLTEGGSYLI